MKTNVAIIGAGMMGRIHARAWSELPGVHISAVVDCDRTAADALAQRYRALSTTSLTEGLADAMIVSICTPPHVHAEHVEAAARIGADILLEKPAATTVSDYERMQEAIDRSGVRLMVGMTGRFYPECRRAFAALNDGTIGRPIAYAEHMHFDASELPDWYFQRPYAGGGVLLTNGIHSFDRVLWLLQPQNVRILAATVRSLGHRGDVEDFADIVLDCDGIICRVQLLWQPGADAIRTVELVGERGTLYVEMYRGITITNADGQQSERPYREQADFLERTLVGVRGEVQALLEARTAGIPAPSSLDENRRAFDLIMDIYRYAQGGADD
ncbi:MAG: Gfo/Idh/MocA family oxidoreductase [Roseiflexaceae bacterium]|nr:Gfo/Idh/MocA family oxidoreductase [Roseiflexus sp.]MDW8214799.1 Gfo/Idh/MocA family oxidoreductase [Roseiflexaceae bacterium]